MDFFVVLECLSYHVGLRRRRKPHVRIQHRVTKNDVMKWFQVKVREAPKKAWKASFVEA